VEAVRKGGGDSAAVYAQVGNDSCWLLLILVNPMLNAKSFPIEVYYWVLDFGIM
jgi:hypothetical protein